MTLVELDKLRIHSALEYFTVSQTHTSLGKEMASNGDVLPIRLAPSRERRPLAVLTESAGRRPQVSYITWQ